MESTVKKLLPVLYNGAHNGTVQYDSISITLQEVHSSLWTLRPGRWIYDTVVHSSSAFGYKFQGDPAVTHAAPSLVQYCPYSMLFIGKCLIVLDTLYDIRYFLLLLIPV